MILENEPHLYDISRTLQDGIPVWPGDPGFQSRWAMLRREGAPCNVSAFCMGTHTGTHIDAPLHLDDAGEDVAGIKFRNLIGPARVFSISTGNCIRSKDLERLDWIGVERVLFKTRSGSCAEKPFEHGYAYLDEGASEFLVNCGILLVGTDAPSVDSFESPNLPSHQILLNHGVVILEATDLTAVPPGDYQLICLPLKLAGLDGSPVRAILLGK
jgi:arylformamidase